MAFLKHYSIPYADAPRNLPAVWQDNLLIIRLS